MKKITTLALAITLIVAPAHQASSSELDSKDTIVPIVAQLSNGATVSTYTFPDGSVMRVPSGLTKEMLLATSAQDLAAMGIPERPIQETELSDWVSEYSSIGEAKPETLIVDEQAVKNILYSNFWGGYLAGTTNVINTSYVAVKANFVVPSITQACTATSNYRVGFWVGLGGWNNGADDLVQQGIGYCSPLVSNKFVPWTEFANTQSPYAFCGYSTWAFNTGDIIYNNMSYQSSTDTAYFYMQDQTTGVAHSCSRSAPAKWSFNGNVAECISETPPGSLLADYGSVRFTNCQVELGSNSTWYPIGARSSIKAVINVFPAPALQAQDTGPLGSDNKSFTMTFLRSY